MYIIIHVTKILQACIQLMVSSYLGCSCYVMYNHLFLVYNICDWQNAITNNWRRSFHARCSEFKPRRWLDPQHFSLWNLTREMSVHFFLITFYCKLLGFNTQSYVYAQNKHWSFTYSIRGKVGSGVTSSSLSSLSQRLGLLASAYTWSTDI